MTEVAQQPVDPQALVSQGLDQDTADWITNCLNNEGLAGQIMVKMWFAIATGETTVEQLGQTVGVIKE